MDEGHRFAAFACRNYGFCVGNKRTAWVFAWLLLCNNGFQLTAGLDVDVAVFVKTRSLQTVTMATLARIAQVLHELSGPVQVDGRLVESSPKPWSAVGPCPLLR